MNIELTSKDLLVVAGNGAFIWMVMYLFVRPWLKRAAAIWWYPGVMNAIAGGVGLLGALAATALPGYSYENIVNAILVALGGTLAAVGGNEVVGNMLSWYSAKKE